MSEVAMKKLSQHSQTLEIQTKLGIYLSGFTPSELAQFIKKDVEDIEDEDDRAALRGEALEMLEPYLVKAMPVGLQRDMDKWAISQCGQIAGKTFRKIADSHPIDLSYEDIKAELLLWYSIRRAKVILDWDGQECSWKGYIASMLERRAMTRMSKAFDNRAKGAGIALYDEPCQIGVTHDEDGVVQHIVINNRDPETILIEEQDTKEMQETVQASTAMVQEYCQIANVPYNEDAPLSSLRDALAVYSAMPAEEKQALGEPARLKFERMIKTFEKNQVKIVKQGKDGRTVGIKKVLQEYLTQGIIDTKAILDKLDEDEIPHNKRSVPVMLGKLRAKVVQERAGGHVPAMRESVAALIRKEFDQGRGILTVPAMQARLNELGVHYVPSTVRFQMKKLLKQYGLYKSRVHLKE